MSRPFFSIITPTLQRESLLLTCESVNQQTYKDWQHIVVVDCETLDLDLIEKIKHPQRVIAQCPVPHKNGGNTCRHNGWTLAKGEYVQYLDDDNYLADEEVLEAIHNALLWKGFPLVAFFPILRLGSIFFPDGAPRLCHVDTANLIVAKEVGQWPDIPDYTSDGIFIEHLVHAHPYASFESFNPIIVMPVISGGK